MSDRLRILFAGSGAFGLPTLQALVERHEVVRVYTQPDKPAGRGNKLTPTPVAQWCDENHIEAVRTPKFNDEALPDADVLVVIAFGQKISQSQADASRLGSMNLHASLLPKYRGAAPIHHALLAGETIVGNSVIRLAEKMDAGDVLGRNELAVNPSETTGELHDRLADAGPELVLRVIDELAAGTNVAEVQDHDAATAAGKLSRDDARLDFTRSAAEVVSKINALSPWPGCRVKVGGAAMTLLRAAAEPGTSQPGILDADGFIGTGDGRVRVIDIKPDGKRAMSLDTYRNGKPWEKGSVVESA